MRALRGLPVLVLVGVMGVLTHGGFGYAQALPGCGGEAARIRAQHPREWVQAGAPAVECASPLVPPGRVGWFDTRANTIRLAAGYDGAYGRAVAHELGHAWQYRAIRRSPGLVETFAVVRGFANAWSVEAQEDYAEVFAYALGEWATQVETVTRAPYGFTVAGMPDEAQVAVLRVSGVLPFGGAGC